MLWPLLPAFANDVPSDVPVETVGRPQAPETAAAEPVAALRPRGVRVYGELTSLALLSGLGANVEWRDGDWGISAGAGVSALLVADAAAAMMSARAQVHGFTGEARGLEVAIGLGPTVILPETSPMDGVRSPAKLVPWPTLFVGYRAEGDRHGLLRIGVGSDLGALGLIIGLGGHWDRT